MTNAPPLPSSPTPLSQLVGHALQLVYWMLDDSEEIADGKLLLDTEGWQKFCAISDRLDSELPAEAGYVSSYPNNVRLAIAQLEHKLAEAEHDLVERQKQKVEFHAIATTLRDQLAAETARADANEKDARRLVFACSNEFSYVELSHHVIKVGGTGDISDCRIFIDAALAKS